MVVLVGFPMVVPFGKTKELRNEREIVLEQRDAQISKGFLAT